MSRQLRRLVGVLSAVAAVATFAALPVGAVPVGPDLEGKGPTTVEFTQNSGTVTVSWGGGYFGPTLALYPEGTACPTAPNGVLPATPSLSKGLSTSTSPIIVSLSTSVLPGWGPGYATLTSGTYNFCMYNVVFTGTVFFNLVNSSGWIGTVSVAGPVDSSDPSLPTPGDAPPEDDPSTTPAAPTSRPSFTG